MPQRSAEHGVKNIERRLTAVEQILPTLATRAQTKADIEAAVAPLPTRQEMRAAIETAVAPLATREEMRAGIQAAIASLATKAEVRAEIQAATSPLATKAEVRAEGVETRRHFDVVVEGMHADIRMLAEGLVTTQARCDTRHRDVMRTLNEHARRLTRLEALPSKRR